VVDVRDELRRVGYVIITSQQAGLPPEAAVREALEPALKPQQGGKLHAQWTAPWLEVAGIMRYGVQFDYFRNPAGVVVGAHRDGHDGTGIVWSLARECDGGETYLVADAGERQVMQHPLVTGEVLIFDDTRFRHGVTEVTGDGAWRDVLVINKAKVAPAVLAVVDQ
jgi:2OG-Fe dioxygenase